MNFKKEKTNQITAIVVTIVTAIVFSFLFLFLGINHRRDVYNDSKKLAIEISRKAAFEVQVYLSSAKFEAKSIEEKVLLLRKHKTSRKEVCKILKIVCVEGVKVFSGYFIIHPIKTKKSN